MHGSSRFSEGGSCDDVVSVIKRFGIVPEEAMTRPGAMVGDSLANFNEFFPALEAYVNNQIMKQGYDDVIAVGKRMVEFFFYPHKQTLVRIGIDVEIYTTFRFAERNLCKFLGGDSLISCNKCTNN
ncbi:hypothetical protein [Prevotella sp. AGR2160]|uniref:hypothetical protein n=1 Tax=Prevotella sp. AGR2160 TaxID=1280674 RepID=UPI0004240E90